MKAVRLNGRDITDTPLPFGTKDDSLTDVEVVVTNRAREIAGTVTDGRGQPTADYTVIVFATDRGRWYSQSRFMAFARPGPDGAFAVRGLPRADYLVVAVDRMQSCTSLRRTSRSWRLCRSASICHVVFFARSST